MKKALLLLAAAAACAIALPATAARNKTLKGSGRIVTETRACRIVAGGTSRIDATGLKSEQWDTTVGKYSALKR